MFKSFLKIFRKKAKSDNGFSLIELSVAISIAASATIAFLSWTQPPNITDAQKAIKTKEKISDIEKAIQAFVVERGRLPCPADPLKRIDNSYASGTDYYPNDFGTEDLDTNDQIVNGLTTLGIDCHNSQGSVPVYSLGLGKEHINDGWERRFTYKVSSNLCGADAGISASPTAVENEASRINGCTKMDYADNAKIGDITVTDGAGTPTNLTTQAAYVIVSHGANGFGAYLPSGTLFSQTGGGTNEDENADADTTFVKAAKTSTFDDIISFKTKAQINNLINKSHVAQISVEECELNSTRIADVDMAMSTIMTSRIDYEHSNTYNRGEQVGLGLLMALQSICVEYYGAAAATIQNKTWSGAKCPGGGTYSASTNSCSCADDSWDGDCSL